MRYWFLDDASVPASMKDAEGQRVVVLFPEAHRCRSVSRGNEGLRSPTPGWGACKMHQS